MFRFGDGISIHERCRVTYFAFTGVHGTVLKAIGSSAGGVMAFLGRRLRGLISMIGGKLYWARLLYTHVACSLVVESMVASNHPIIVSQRKVSRHLGDGNDNVYLYYIQFSAAKEKTTTRFT